jgi:hypothetical protein
MKHQITVKYKEPEVTLTAPSPRTYWPRFFRHLALDILTVLWIMAGVVGLLAIAESALGYQDLVEQEERGSVRALTGGTK